MESTTTSTNGTADLQERLQDPETAQALSRLLDRLDTIERTVDALERLERQWPMALQTAADTLDDELTRAADRGVVFDERAREALTIAEKLTKPETADTITRLIDRLDRLEEIAEWADQIPGTVATGVDVLDDALTRAADRGVVVDERVRRGLLLLERLTEDETAAALERLLGRTDDIDRLAELAEQAPDLIATAVDLFDDEYARAAERGYDPEQALRRAFGALGRLGELFQSDEFQALLDSGVLDPEALKVVGSLGSALVETHAEAARDETPKQGLFGLLGALRDPDVQRSIGFLTSVAKKFGQNLRG